MRTDGGQALTVAEVGEGVSHVTRQFLRKVLEGANMLPCTQYSK